MKRFFAYLIAVVVGVPLLALVFLFCLALFSVNTTKNVSQPRPESVPPPQVTAAELRRMFLEKKADNLTLLHLRRQDVSRSEGGLVLYGTFDIANNTDVPIKDVIVSCKLFGSSGTTITSRRLTIYELIPSKKTKRGPKISMGVAPDQLARYACEIVGFEYALEAIPR